MKDEQVVTYAVPVALPETKRRELAEIAERFGKPHGRLVREILHDNLVRNDYLMPIPMPPGSLRITNKQKGRPVARTVSLRIPMAVRSSIREAAWRRKTTISEYIRDVLLAYLEEQQSEPVSS